jgi:hypothetical protein
LNGAVYCLKNLWNSSEVNAMKWIPRKPLEDLDDTVMLYGLWHIQYLSNSVVPVSKTS